MIDFEKELQKYDFENTDKDLKEMKHETALSIQHFSNMFKKLRQEQNEVNGNLEEVTTSIEEIKKQFHALSELQQTLKEAKEENLNLLKTFIATLDQFEDYYNYIREHADNNWISQFDTIWSHISNILFSQGIYRIEEENSWFNPQLHVAKSVSNFEQLPEGMVTKIIKSGYIYKNTVLRKAEVTVNKPSGGETN